MAFQCFPESPVLALISCDLPRSSSPARTGPRPALSVGGSLVPWLPGTVPAKWHRPCNFTEMDFLTVWGPDVRDPAVTGLISPVGSIFSLQKGICRSSYIQISFCCPIPSSCRDLSPFDLVRTSPSWPSLALITALKAQSTKTVSNIVG